MSTTQAAAPRLLRAVADSTQPHGPLLGGDAVHTLQEFFNDPAQIDTIYRTVLDRASGEPLSLGVVAKCVALFKCYLPRFKASHEVLLLVDSFCTWAGSAYGPMSAALHRSITYLQALVVRLIGSQRQRRLSAQPTSNAQHQKSASDTPVTVPSVNLSRAASTPVPELIHKRSTGSVAQLLNARLSLTIEEGTSASWAIHHDMATARFGVSQPKAVVCHRMAVFLPGLPTSPPWPDQEEGFSEEPADLSKSGAAVEAVQEHVKGIAALQRLQASQEGYNADPTFRSHRPRLRDHRPRLLFQYLPYNQQEALQLAEPDVQAVLEANFGAQEALGCWGVQQPEELWGDRFGRQAGGTGGFGSDSAGHICASILVKLIIDMYLKAGPALSYPLALLMLQRAASSHSSLTRARPFDVLYNLSVHAEMLYPPSDDSSQAVSSKHDPDSVLEQAWAQSSGLGQWPLPQNLHHPLHVFQTWLRQLLWELSSLAAQRGETSPEVWEAVLGCIVQLTTHSGYTVRAFLDGISQNVVAALLHCCVQHCWSQEVYCQLIRIAVNLLYVPMPSPASSDDDDDNFGGVAQGDSSKPAAHLQLSQELLSELGGMSMLIAHFKQAPTMEACRNLLAVMLDYITLRLVQGGEGASQEDFVAASMPVYSQQGLAAVMPALMSNHAPAALQAAAQAGDPGFASALAHLLQQSFPLHQAGNNNQIQSPMATSGLLRQQPSPEHLVSVLVDQLEALTCAGPDAALPASLQAIVDHTLQCIRSSDPTDVAHTAHQEGIQSEAEAQHGDLDSAEEHVVLDEAWQCLAELLCDEDDYTASVGQTWLYKLLTEAADCHMASVHQQNADSDNGQLSSQTSQQLLEYQEPHVTAPHVIGLLPHPLGGPPKPGAPAHLSHQPQLAGLLRLVLSHTGGGINAGHRFMMVVRRLVLHVKLKCTALSSGADASDDGLLSPRHSPPASPQTRHRASKHSTPLDNTSSAESASRTGTQQVSRSASADNISMHNELHPDPLVSLGIAPQSLTRTSPALSWGQAPDPSPSLGRPSNSDLARSSSSTVHNRTHSDARSDYSLWQGTSAESPADAEGSNRVSQQAGVRASHDSAVQHRRAPSSVLSTAELTGLLQDEVDGAISHEGIVLHDAPLLHAAVPASQPHSQEPMAHPESASGSLKQRAGLWQPQAAAGLVLSTLYLAMEWVLQAAPANRVAASQDLAQLLLLFLCTPPADDADKGGSPAATPRPSHPTQVTIDIPANDPAHVTIRMPSPQGSVTPANTPPPSAKAAPHSDACLAPASSLAWCFLHGLVAVPSETLCQVQPVLLVRLLHHLQQDSKGNSDGGTVASPASPQGTSNPELEDMRVALVLLLIARCSSEPTALQEAGGEALFTELLKDRDARVRYHASVLVQKRLMTLKPQQYRKALRQLTQQAQQQNDEKVLQNPHLQVSTMLDMRLIDFAV